MSRLKILPMKIRIQSGRVAAFLVALLLIGGGAGVLLTGCGGDHGTADQAKEKQLYTCGMHPQVIQDKPGNCPICGMPLSKRRKGATAKLPEGVLTRVQFTPYRIAQGGIRTSSVEWMPLEREISTVGFVDYDERKLARIAARFPGRVESLAVDFTGTSVEKGRPLATLYSPEVFAAEESLLAAAREGGGEGLADHPLIHAEAREVDDLGRGAGRRGRAGSGAAGGRGTFDAPDADGGSAEDETEVQHMAAVHGAG